MGRFIPNENSFVAFTAALTGTKSAPKLADITGAVDLTTKVMGLTASTAGNAVPTPTFDTTFETSIPGTVTASFSLDGYRDDDPAEDLVWTTLPRGTEGFAEIARSGGVPIVGDSLEMWPITVLSRSVPSMSSNTVVSTTVTCSVPSVPDEDAIVVT